jgi:hypothetical protein
MWMIFAAEGGLMEIAHTESRECPVCKSFCLLAKDNSLTPYEEIDAEMHRNKRSEPECEGDLPPLFSRKKIKHNEDETVEPAPLEFGRVKHY